MPQIQHKPIVTNRTYIIAALALVGTTILYNLPERKQFEHKEKTFITNIKEDLFDSHKTIINAYDKKTAAKADSAMKKCADYLKHLADSVAKSK